MKLDLDFIDDVKSRIESEILTVMENIYDSDSGTYSKDYRPGFKEIEKTVSFYDYSATGISVLAKLASNGNERALALIQKINRNIDYYRKNIYMHDRGDRKAWNVPLRRLLLHIALAYKRLCPSLSSDDKQLYVDLVNEQVPIAIKHCENFFPGQTDIHILPVNNHAAIFMQGIYYCGKVFNMPEWMDMAIDFAERYFASGHEDGYFEEHTNEEREGGPSLAYTSLTAGCLYDVLDGKSKAQEKFIKAGKFYRSFLNYDFQRMPVADERTNASSDLHCYGLALHSLSSQGRYFIVKILENTDFSKCTPEHMAVIYHELDLMLLGDCSLSENRHDGAFCLSLPLGVLRKNGFTAGISALRALNRVIAKDSDYALDQQDFLYLSHEKGGVVLTGVKSKNNPDFSTFRIADDAYSVRTGSLAMGNDWAEASVFYKTFAAKIRWEIGRTAKLTLSSDSDEIITSNMPFASDKLIKTDAYYEVREIAGFSPYTENNVGDKVKTLVFRWKKNLTIEFLSPSN